MVIPTLARISEVIEVTGGWAVKQESSPLPRYHFQLWHKGCRGKLRHGICVFSLADLSTILRSSVVTNLSNYLIIGIVTTIITGIWYSYLFIH